MENLKLLKVQRFPLNHVTGRIIHLDINSETNETEAYFIESKIFLSVNLKTAKKTVFINDLSNVIHAEYMWSKNKVTVSSSDNIIVVDCDTKDVYKYGFNKKVLRLGWNREYDNLVVVFHDGCLQSFQYDLLKCELVPLGKGHIRASVRDRENVGWGSENTQFQYPTKPIEVGTTDPHMQPQYESMPFLTWNPNGNDFIINFVGRNRFRRFKVFNQRCEPIAKSGDSIPIMYGPIAWKPEGNIIAAAMFEEGKNCIGLFEKNGRFRVIFHLVDVYYPIKLLSWSSCGRVLYVAQKDDKGDFHVCLYVTSNDKWYLKQHLVFPNKKGLNLLCWANTTPHCVELIAGTKEELMHFKYRFEFDFDHKNKLVVAIDGKRIRVHGLQDSIDPCPFSSDTVVLNNPINMLAFHPSKDLAAAVDSSNILYGFSIVGTKLTFSYAYLLSIQDFPLDIHHLFWKESSPHFIFDKKTERSSLYEYNEEQNNIIKKFEFAEFLHPIEHIHAIKNVIIIHNATGCYTHNEDGITLQTQFSYYPIRVIPLEYSGKFFYLIQTSDLELIVEDDYVFKDVTSMVVHNDFLSLTTNDKLYTIPLNKDTLETLAEDGLGEYFSRSFHEVASIVCMVGDSPKILLYTPRGNLEVVSCRPMEISILENKLSNRKWGEAIEFMRLAQLNWNLLIDLNPDRFYENLPKIVAVSNSQHVLNAIVGKINNENCLMTDYNNATKVIPYTSLNKREEFLEKLINYLNSSGVFADYIPTVMKICLDQGKVDEALHYVSYLMNEDDANQKAEEAIALLKIHVSADDLFKSALKVFDLDLAGLVARKCQLNPQEINPILEGLRNMGPFQMRLAIHLRCENWEEAIVYMLRQRNVNKEDILKFVTEKEIEKRAYMECLQLNIDFKEEIARLYIKKLVSQKCHHEAAVIFAQLNFYGEAIEQFKLDLNHKKVLEYLPLLALTDDFKNNLLRDLAEKLADGGKTSEAATIYANYLNEYETAVIILVNGGRFMDAMMIARKHNLHNIIDICILPKILDTLQTIADTIKACQESFSTFLLRLKKLRYVKKYNYEQRMKRTYGNGVLQLFKSFESDRMSNNENDFYRPDCDVGSIISTGSCRSDASSFNSTMSSKQIRKMEKMRQDTTEGNKFEDIAIMRELHLIITKIFLLGPELRELILRLIEYSLIDLHILRLHHSKLYNLQKLMKDAVVAIWDPNFVENSEMPYISENYLFMDQKFRVYPVETDNPGFTWILEMFKE